ncbi:MAG: nucleotidyltransferase domain-containing protein [Acidobacteria bacterium]|jgi:predicted nucleotidyltransferase|nr:nucleotidyltransferase domain-containing protein [Acidobacteriota bacterium]
MVEKEIANLIKRFINELKKENIIVKKVFLFGSYARGTQRKDSDIDIAIIIESNGEEQIDKKINPWKYAARVDTRLAPIALWESEMKKDYIPIIWEIKNGLDVTKLAA